jgi:holliday junction DNA helicase RuvA
VIGALRGTLARTGPEKVLIHVGGLGFEVRVTPRDVAAFGPIGAEATLHTHLHVRDDAVDLYGFTDMRDRDLFRLLLTASGIGPKVAMAMLGTMRSDEIRRAVITEDAHSLTVVPGIGTRSAQKLILELRPKIVGAEADMMGDTTRARVRDALEGLGYGATEIHDVVAALPEEGSVEESLRRALQELGKR